MIAIYPIVEGHGEVIAMPVLIRRIMGEICTRYDIDVLSPYRLPRGRMLAEQGDHLERAIELGARKIRQTEMAGIIIVLVDADDQCPAELGPRLAARIARDDVPIGVVLANREFEAWFLCGVRSLRGHRGISAVAEPPENPETIRGAKEYLARHYLRPGATYSETVDQVALAAVLDLAEARGAPSFDKLCRDLCRLIPANLE